MAWAGTRGKALKVAKPVFPPRAPPFRARSCCRLWNYVKILEGRWILLRWQWKVEPIYADVNILAKRFFKLRSARKAVCKANLFLNNSYTPQSRKQACYAGSFPIQPETINIAEATNIAEVTNSAEATIGSAGYCQCRSNNRLSRLLSVQKQQSAQPATVSAEAIIGSAGYCQYRSNNRSSQLLSVQKQQSAQPATVSTEVTIDSACHCQCSRIQSRNNNRLSLPLPIQQNTGLSRYTYTFHNASQRRGQEGKSARRGDGLRNYECFPFSQITHFQKVKPIIQKNQTIQFPLT